jgi:hypothetical protein
MGTLYSLVMMATYAHGYVVVLISTIVLLNSIILKSIFLGKTHMKSIIEKFYNQQKESGTKETNAIFLNAMFTSWVAPCTVWTSKFKFLMVSSSITLPVHLLNFFTLFLISNSNIMNQMENPPILHCFHSHKNFSNISYNYYHSENETQRLINVCSQNDDCFPLIRICSENEMHNTLMNTYIIPIGILLFFSSFFSSLCLQILSNYTKMYAFLKTFCQVCPKAFYWFLTDFIFNFNELEETLRKQVLNNIKKEVTKNVAYKGSIKCVLTLHCDFFERSEETKSLKIKLEEIAKENDKESAKDISLFVWKLPPMHSAANSYNFGLWCFMYILGGEAGALNGQPNSSINSIIEKSRNDNSLLERCNFFSRHLIKTAKEMYGEYALHKAINLGDIRLLQILIANGYDIDESDKSNKTPLLLALEVQNIEYLKIFLQQKASVKKRT